MIASSQRLDRGVARAVILTACLLALTGDSLLREGINGMGMALFVAILCAEAAARVARGQTAVPRGRCVARRRALCNGAARYLARGEAKGLIRAGTRFVGHVARGVVPTLLHDTFAAGERSRSTQRMWRALRTIAIGGGIALLFGGLLRGADPIFASFVQLPGFDPNVVASHMFVFCGIAWMAAGWSRGALLEGTRQGDNAALPLPAVTIADITTALGVLNVLFAAFVASQLGAFFGGEAFLRTRTGLTAASYARHGFFEMVLIVALVVPILIATRPAPGEGVETRAAARRHTILALPMIGLLSTMILSALFKLHLYIGYFGLTTDRVYPMGFMLWLGAVLVWFAATVLRNRPQTFLAGALLSALGVLAALNVAAPDRMVALLNVERATHSTTPAGPPLDLAHLSSLSAEAADVAVAQVLAASSVTPSGPLCTAAGNLLSRWGSRSAAARLANAPASWRYWNVGECRAMRIVAAHEAVLLRIQFANCTATRSSISGSSRT
jgi:hypothetical protein